MYISRTSSKDVLIINRIDIIMTQKRGDLSDKKI